jgi:hypothetical protein
MRRVCAPDGPRRRLTQAEVADLAGRHQFGHGPDRLLDRHVRVHPVLVVEIEVIDPEPAQRGVQRPPDVLGPAVRHAGWRVRRVRAELGRQLDLVAPAGQRPAEQLLVRLRSIVVGRVEEGDAQLDRAVDRGDRPRLVDRAVAERHPHAAEADGRDLEALAQGSSGR